MKKIILGDSAEVLPTLPDRFARLVYVDPPFNTGKTQKRERMRVTASDESGERLGFGGRRYRVQKLASRAYGYRDAFDDFEGFLIPRIEACLRCLTTDGSLFVHLDSREVHYVKVALDRLLGRDHFMNEIIWAYDYGGRGTTKWAQKHDTILWYAMDPVRYTFRRDESDRLPYMAPNLVTAEKRARGKLPTDTWWNTIVSPTGKEKTGYPTQKPLAILERIVKVHSKPGDVLLDFFAGSGSFGDAADRHGRDVTLVDSSAAAIRV
ncbi:MAG TPA: site-specific DNA-methyltransferase, partial [Polyangiaceae bacterium]|nr:site-specific DNA-methyltransferase [Polyangiaceae bacterium]